MGCLIVLIGVV
jgi:NADH-quinone oxidoreductase subunit H